MASNYKVVDIGDGVPRPVEADNPEAIAYLIRDGLSRDVFDKAQKIYEDWRKQEAEKQRVSSLEHQKMRMEKAKPVNRFLRALRQRHFDFKPLEECEKTFSLENLHAVEQELPPMPYEDKTFARNWLVSHIARLQSEKK